MGKRASLVHRVAVVTLGVASVLTLLAYITTSHRMIFLIYGDTLNDPRIVLRYGSFILEGCGRGWWAERVALWIPLGILAAYPISSLMVMLTARRIEYGPGSRGLVLFLIGVAIGCGNI